MWHTLRVRRKSASKVRSVMHTNMAQPSSYVIKEITTKIHIASKCTQYYYNTILCDMDKTESSNDIDLI